MKFRVLGHLEVVGGAGNVALGSPKQRTVLAILLLHANEIVPTDRIIDLVWGESPPRTAEHSVQIYISELRKALAGSGAGDLIETRPPGYLINVHPDDVDSLLFERLVHSGIAAVRSGDADMGRAHLQRAVDSWSGQPLIDFTYEEFAQGHIRSLSELYTDALETLAGIAVEEGALEEARQHARDAIEHDPLREEPNRLMMLVLFRSGRQAEALRHYAAYREQLADELGIEPTESLRQLEERILLQDPELAAATHKPVVDNPYRGLRPFSEEDAGVYFGREALLAEVLDRLDRGSGFVSIIGPSGSGKSSVARAGVTPELRRRGEQVVVLQPGPRPLWELAGAIEAAGLGGRTSVFNRFESDPEALASIVTRPLVLVIDQFEEAFTLAAPDEATRFFELIASAVRRPETPMKIVATLRADYFDRPLSVPALAGVFSDSLVSTHPMTPSEIEAAVTGPARTAGVEVEPALLAQLVADMGTRPGALPLLQFTLFELFERADDIMALADYRAIGGINGALMGGADELLRELDPRSQAVTEQVMMRMVQKGATTSTARPVPVRDLIELGVDTVALQRVLEAFGTRRLVTFDRDSSGAAVIEIAHEYLLTEWSQMEQWVTQHGEDLERLHALQQSAADWVEGGKSDDYLLRGERLDRVERWVSETALLLTSAESDFVTQSVALRERETVESLAREQKEESLRRSARRRLWAFGVSVVAFAAAATVLVMTLIPDPPLDVVLWFGDEGNFGDLIMNGAYRAIADNDLTSVHYSDADPGAITPVRAHLERGARLIVLAATLQNDSEVMPLVIEYPETHFVWMDCQNNVEMGTRVNESCILSSHVEMGYLAGAAAATQSRTGHVGALIGLNQPFMQSFHSGFEQGARFVDEQIEVSVLYLSEWPWEAFDSPTLARIGARSLMADGVDVMFAAAGGSGEGMFDAILLDKPADTDVWGVGVDVDEYMKFEGWKRINPDYEWWLEGVQQHILTSVVKDLGGAVYESIEGFFASGDTSDVEVSIKNSRLFYAKSGDHIDALLPDLEAAIQAVIDGQVVLDDRPVADIEFVVDAQGT
ncbi:MAG TPA: BTAD domain-containing putative transcriptional regulator [Acidimicrobiia bacterium]|nr:BTAD domain-containing putative transcriptional regulator [Acidimicrobiia bacterium]